MGTIKDLEEDMLLQVPYLQSFSPQKQLSGIQKRLAIFCGTGDSYAAALLAEAFSKNTARAMDPLDLIKNPHLAKGKTVYLISISGRTISNIKAAKTTKHSVAVTSNKKSKLARVCSKIIHLDYPSSGEFTAGSISFVASALSCISLVTKIKAKNFANIFEDAVSQSRKIKLRGRVFFVGNYHTYPVAMYATAKLYEVLGYNAYYERIEQFSHMELFSIKRGDTVIIFEKKNPHNAQLARHLKKIGLNVIRPEPKTNDKLKQVLFFTFVSQLVPLLYAKKKNQRECYFINAKKIQNASSAMIY